MQRESALSNGAYGLRAWALGALVLGVGCASETVVHNLNEKEANLIIEVLADNDINAHKLVNASGREVVYDISVPGADRLNSIRVLNKHELPRRRDKGYTEIFSESGLIPTSAEEKAKKLAALEGEIERQIKLIDGVLDVQVQVVMPDESALRTTREQEPATTASVTIKYLPGPNGERPVTESQIQALVASGVEKLLPENVKVLIPQPRVAGSDAGAAGAPEAKFAHLQKLNKRLMMGLAGAGAFVVLLGLGFLYTRGRLSNVRGRLVRLQNEIAKAKRKPGEVLSGPGQAV